MSVQEKAILVTLNIKQWTGRKYDKKISAEVEQQHQAKDAGRYNKVLIAKEALQKKQKTASAARTFFYENTLAWGDDGYRLLPSANYFTFVGEIQRLKGDDETAAVEFLDNYDAYREDAKINLNGMYNPADYPSREELRHKFSFNVEFMPMPNSNDFRVNLSDTEINTLKLGLENSLSNRLKNAMQDIKDRIKEQLDHMKNKLSNKDEIFRDSLFENLRDIINLIPKLNITGDSQIDQICEDMRTLLVENPDNVRQNAMLRSRKAQEVENIIDKFSEFFNS